MNEYIPSPRQWVADQVNLYEKSGGTKGITLRDTGLPCIIITHIGWKTGAIRKTPVMTVQDGNNYVLIASIGGAPKNPLWYYNLKENPLVKIRDRTEVYNMKVREVHEGPERERLWGLAVSAYPPYKDYQQKTNRIIPVFIAEPNEGEH
ncbi:MAG: nitroreductase [Chloroflexi bacterium]|nr:nitroreductase [Chloroflexota bacterium]|tara:strand:+ start:542 stop:988 length:447 start_codon:yes stop_codon:yes gene_type:complete